VKGSLHVDRMANFENPNHNIELPVFIIHGNHDDPTGIGHVSAIDLLSSAAFVNYFGKEARSELPCVPAITAPGCTSFKHVMVVRALAMQATASTLPRESMFCVPPYPFFCFLAHLQARLHALPRRSWREGRRR